MAMSTPGQGLQPGTTPYIQARNNGFGTPKKSSREETNETVEAAYAETADQLARKALDVFKQSMDSRDEKVRLDAANKVLQRIHQPTQQLDVNVNDVGAITPEMRKAADELTPEELSVVDRWMQMMVETRERDTIEVTDVEVLGEEATGG